MRGSVAVIAAVKLASSHVAFRWLGVLQRIAICYLVASWLEPLLRMPESGPAAACGGAKLRRSQNRKTVDQPATGCAIGELDGHGAAGDRHGE